MCVIYCFTNLIAYIFCNNLVHQISACFGIFVAFFFSPGEPNKNMAFPSTGPEKSRFRVDDVEPVRLGHLNWLGSSAMAWL